MSFTGKRPTFNTAALTPQSTAPSNPVSGDMYINDGSGSIEGGLYRYNGTGWVRLDNRERNLVINGGFDFWQRGTSATLGTSGSSRICDMWLVNTGFSSGSVSQTRSADKPNNAANYSMRFTASTGVTLSGSNRFIINRHFIEGFNIRELAGKPFVLSFWVRSSVTGQHALAFANGGVDRYFATSYTINVADTWEKKYVRVPAFDITSGTWNIANGRGLAITFGLGSSSDRLTTASTVWQTGGPFDGATGSVNVMATTSNIWAISDVMLTAGEDKKHDFYRSGHSYAHELNLCQRYFYKTYNLDVDPGTVTNAGSEDIFITEFPSATGRQTRKSVKFPTHMRAAPTITTYDLTTGTSGNWRTLNGNVTSTVTEISENSARIAATDSGAATTTMLWQGHFTAAADIP